MINSITIVLIRILAGLCFFNVLSGLPLALSTLSNLLSYDDGGGEFFGWTILMVITVQLTVGVLLWVQAKRIAASLNAGVPQDETAINIDQIVAAGSFLIGLYWVVVNIGGAITRMISAYKNSNDWFMQQGYLEILLSAWLPIVIGLALMAGSGAIARLFRWVRRAD